MNFIIVLLLNLLILMPYALGMESLIFRQAERKDLAQLLTIVDTQAIQDRDKIVILPKKFRSMSLESAIDKKSMFVAEQDGEIVGYKKLFLVTDQEQKNDMLCSEIRCIDNENNCAFVGYADSSGNIISSTHELPYDFHKVCIYNGGDFTLPSFRNKGINQQLTKTALGMIAHEAKEQIRQQQSRSISMLFGLTQANAGEQPGARGDRTPNISKTFAEFVQNLENTNEEISFSHRRYQAFMPTFDPEGAELKPLSDDQSIPGFGCVLTYQLRNFHD